MNPPTRTLMDKAHRGVVSLLGLVTVVSTVYFGMNAYSIVSQVYGQQQHNQKQADQSKTSAVAGSTGSSGVGAGK